jgi:hypothetical protein
MLEATVLLPIILMLATGVSLIGLLIMSFEVAVAAVAVRLATATLGCAIT